MTFKFKISRRLSTNAVLPFVLTLAAALGCRQNPGLVDPTAATSSPNPVTDLAVTSQTDSSVTLSFTEVDDGSGKPADYELRYSIGAMNWDSATIVTDGSCAAPIQGTTVGATRTCTTLGLTANTDYTFQLMSFSPTDTTTSSTSNHGNGKGSNQAKGRTNSGTKIAKVSVSPSSLTDTVGQSTKLAATVTDNHGNKMTGVTVTWSTTAPNVVAVSDSGVVSALAAGSATVLAVAGSDTGTAAVSVTKPGAATTAPGTANVTISGFSSGTTSAGSVKLVSATNVSTTVTLSTPSSGTASGSANVAAGTYTVTYSPPSGYTLASGDSATKSLSVTSGQTATVSYAVQAVVTTGTAKITVGGFSSTATAAGSVTLTSTTNATTSITLPAPSSGSSTGSATVAAGTYVVKYTPPSGYTLASGDSATKSLSVTSGQTATVSYAVQAVVTTGTAKITVGGFSSTATAAGSVTLTSTSNATTSITLPAPSSGSSTGSATVAAGTYVVKYTPPSGYTLASGDSATKSLSVTSGQTATVSYAVQAVVTTTGTAQVTISGFGSTATAAGSVTLRSTSNATTSIMLPTPSSGSSTGSATVATGTYAVTYAPPSGYTLASGDSATKTVAITSGATSTVTYSVTAVQTPTGMLFHSDWSTGTGTSTTVLNDMGEPVPWNTAPLTAANPSVVTATGFLTIGTPNSFKAPVINGGSGGKAASVHLQNLWPAPTAGSDLYYRAYLYADWPTAEVSLGFGGHHPWESGPGSVNWSFKFGHTQGSDNLVLYFATSSSQDLARVHTPLQFRTEYRIELHAHILSATSYTAEIRIYDAAGNLIRQTKDFDMVNQSGLTLDQVTLTASSYSQWQLMAIGTNGVGNFNATQSDANIWGAVCVRNDTWCGPYTGGI